MPSLRTSAPASSWAKFADPLFISVAFIASPAAYRILFPVNYARFTSEELAGGFLLSVATFWAALRLCEGTGARALWPLLFQQFCVGTGLNLVVSAIFNYFQLLTRSLFLIVIGGLLAAFLLGIARRWIYPKAANVSSGVLIVGFDPVAERLARSLDQPVLGEIGPQALRPPSGLPFLGEFERFEQIVAERNPTHILVASRQAAASISTAALWRLRLHGIEVSDVPTLYEKILERVYCRGLNPAEMLLAPTLCPESRTMALQAIYTNLIGLFLLVTLSPVLAAIAIAVALFSGPGPILESVECSGFHKISFRLLSFRTRRSDGSGELTPAGRIISRLHLAHLPRLLNIVRGEMALFGPRPVRTEFARRLTELLPFYSIRFSVKPGIIGWNQTPGGQVRDLPPCELSEIENDIYYVKQASPMLDLEILIRILSGGKPLELPAGEYAGAAR